MPAIPDTTIARSIETRATGNIGDQPGTKPKSGAPVVAFEVPKNGTKPVGPSEKNVVSGTNQTAAAAPQTYEQLVDCLAAGRLPLITKYQFDHYDWNLDVFAGAKGTHEFNPNDVITDGGEAACPALTDDQRKDVVQKVLSGQFELSGTAAKYGWSGLHDDYGHLHGVATLDESHVVTPPAAGGAGHLQPNMGMAVGAAALVTLLVAQKFPTT